MTTEFVILVTGALLLASIVSSKLSDSFGIPSLLFFLGVGMLAGSEGPGGIEFDSPEQAQTIGTIALMVILYSGGLETRWKAVRPVLGPGLVLSTLGVVLTTLLLGVFAKFILGSFTNIDLGPMGLSWIEAFLLAAIVSSTDAAAVFSVYRTSTVQPRDELRYLLEFESGSNDPMAVLLTTTLLGIMVHGDDATGGLATTLFLQFILGGLIGAAVGFVGSALSNRVRLSTGGLYAIMALALGMLSFGLAEQFHGNGFLSVYITGLVVGNRIDHGREEVLKFHDGLSWLMQILMFIVLGLLVFPSHLVPVAGVSLSLAIFLLLVARPIAVLLCYLPFRPHKNELAYVSWVGLRGSVPIVLATFPATYGIYGAEEIFHIIFFIVLTSVLVQGMTLVPAARYFGVTQADKR